MLPGQSTKTGLKLLLRLWTPPWSDLDVNLVYYHPASQQYQHPHKLLWYLINCVPYYNCTVQPNFIVFSCDTTSPWPLYSQKGIWFYTIVPFKAYSFQLSFTSLYQTSSSHLPSWSFLCHYNFHIEIWFLTVHFSYLNDSHHVETHFKLCSPQAGESLVLLWWGVERLAGEIK